MRKAIIIAAALIMTLGVNAWAGKNVPKTARAIALDLDTQLVERLEMLEGPAKGTTLILTTPTSLDNLEQSSPLARLMAEEMAAWFVKSGYRVQEVRKTKNLILAPGTGELGMSRDLRFVDTRFVKSAVLLSGTYSQTSKNVRFNIKLMHAPTGEVLAMSGGTLTISPETAELLDTNAREQAARVRPSVSTRFLPTLSKWTGPRAYAPQISVAKGPSTLDLTE